MASDPDFYAMSDEDFYGYLREEGMIEEDVQKIQSKFCFLFFFFLLQQIFKLNFRFKRFLGLLENETSYEKDTTLFGPGKSIVTACFSMASM